MAGRKSGRGDGQREARTGEAKEKRVRERRRLHQIPELHQTLVDLQRLAKSTGALVLQKVVRQAEQAEESGETGR